MGESRRRLDAEKRARLRLQAGVSTRGVEVADEEAGAILVNRAGEATTAIIEELVAAGGGTVAALACVLEGVMLNAAWHLWSNSFQNSTPAEFTEAFIRLANAAAEEVSRETKEPAEADAPAG